MPHIQPLQFLGAATQSFILFHFLHDGFQQGKHILCISGFGVIRVAFQKLIKFPADAAWFFFRSRFDKNRQLNDLWLRSFFSTTPFLMPDIEPLQLLDTF
jgi:hypothetical protein